MSLRVRFHFHAHDRQQIAQLQVVAQRKSIRVQVRVAREASRLSEYRLVIEEDVARIAGTFASQQFAEAHSSRVSVILTANRKKALIYVLVKKTPFGSR